MIDMIKRWIENIKSSSIVRPFTVIISWFRENVIKRKLVIFSVLFTTWLSLLLGAIYSPQKLVYTDEQLKTKRTFENGTGEIKLTSQVYSPDTGIILLQFETKDSTSPVNRGIDAKRLEWNLYARNNQAETSMEIVPITDSKISVILRKVPRNFDAFAIDVVNETVAASLIDVSVTSPSSDEDIVSKDKEESEENVVQFYIAMQNSQLKTKKIENVSREEFALSEIREERNFQEDQVKKLKHSIKLLEDAIEDDESRKTGLVKESQYLTGDDLESVRKDITLLESNIEIKKNSIETAKNNITKTEDKISALDLKEAAVKDGTFEFLSPIETVELK